MRESALTNPSCPGSLDYELSKLQRISSLHFQLMVAEWICMCALSKEFLLLRCDVNGDSKSNAYWQLGGHRENTLQPRGRGLEANRSIGQSFL